MTLQEIKDFAKAHGACESQYNKFAEFVDAGDELKAWQTVLGNIDWLNNRGAGLDAKEICELAKGIGLKWYSDGALAVEKNYVNGQLHGTLKEWHSNGTFCIEEYWENGILIESK